MIAVCMKWVDLRPEIDPLTGAIHTDVRTSGPSDADEAALEWALRIGEAWGVHIVALSAGPPEAESMLQDALAAGASEAVRIDVPTGTRSDRVALCLARALPPVIEVVVCGAWSADRGSGSVPAFLAAELGAAQALGIIQLAADAKTIEARRRLDGGRRERLRVTPPAVLSVEGGSARLRRASLDSVLASRDASIRVVSNAGRDDFVVAERLARGPAVAAAPAAGPVAAGPAGSEPPVRTVPYRPRARVRPAPAPGLDARERILVLSGALTDREPPRLVRLDPAAAADELLLQLSAWGYR